jgi:hypothetical protein
MKYVVETEFFGYERQIDIIDDTPFIGAEIRKERKSIRYGPFKTRRGAENAVGRRKTYWRKKGFQHPPKRAELYDPNGNYMFRPSLKGDSKTIRKKVDAGWYQQPDEVTFSIKEKVVSKQPIE